MCLTLSCLLLLFSWKEYRSLSWNAQKQKTKATDLWFGEKNKRTRKRKPRLFFLIGPCKLQIWRQSWSQASSAPKCFGVSSQQQDPPLLSCPWIGRCRNNTKQIDSQCCDVTTVVNASFSSWNTRQPPSGILSSWLWGEKEKEGGDLSNLFLNFTSQSKMCNSTHTSVAKARYMATA